MFFLRWLIKSSQSKNLLTHFLYMSLVLLHRHIHMIHLKKFPNQVWDDRVALYLLSSIKTKNIFHRDEMQKDLFYRFLLVLFDSEL